MPICYTEKETHPILAPGWVKWLSKNSQQVIIISKDNSIGLLHVFGKTLSATTPFVFQISSYYSQIKSSPNRDFLEYLMY